MVAAKLLTRCKHTDRSPKNGSQRLESSPATRSVPSATEPAKGKSGSPSSSQIFAIPTAEFAAWAMLNLKSRSGLASSQDPARHCVITTLPRKAPWNLPGTSPLVEAEGISASYACTFVDPAFRHVKCRCPISPCRESVFTRNAVTIAVGAGEPGGCAGP